MFSQSAFANNHLSRGSVRFVKSLNVYPLFVHLRFKYEKTARMFIVQFHHSI